MFSAVWKKCISGGHLLHIVGGIISLFLAALVLSKSSLLHDMRLKNFDLLIEQMPAPLAEPPVVIVDIDQQSLVTLGQWPWPRSRTAELINKIAAARPAVIGLDIVFAEPDGTSPTQFVKNYGAAMPPDVQRYLNGLPDHDQLLAGVLAASPVPVVVGHLFANRADSSSPVFPLRTGSLLLRGPDPTRRLHSFSHADVNLPLLEEAARGSGFFNIIPDQDAITRRLPLLIKTPGELNLYPSLVLAMLQAAAAEGSPALVESNEHGIREVQVGPYRIPTTERGELLINFSRQPPEMDNAIEPNRVSKLFGVLLRNVLSCFVNAMNWLNFLQAPSNSQEKQAEQFRYVSAAAIFAGRSLNELRKAYVLVGTSAPGLFDQVAVPVKMKFFPGVELHGQALNTILTGSFLQRSQWVEGLDILQLLCISLLLIIFLPRIGAAQGFLLAVAAACGSIVFSIWNFRANHLLVDMVTPTLASGLLYTVLTSLNYFTEKRKNAWLYSAFTQYLAPAVVKELVKNKNHLVLSGEERVLSVLFSDIRGFTSMSEKMRPDALCSFLNEYLTPMTAAVMDRRGTVDKFIGDALMAFWNAPLATPGHVRQACECALDMLCELEKLNKDWLRRGLPSIRIGIGIHCGLARVGNMGSRQRFQYTVIGDMVNLASRLEGLTKHYGVDIIVSGAVHETVDVDIGHHFIFRQIDTVRVVGKSEPVAIYQLLNADNCLDRAEEMEMYSSAFDLYSFGNFTAALPLFQALTKLDPSSKLYALHAARCRNLLENPPAHWDWITDMRSK
ncbi:CHASE2 domain-containing protein [Candidatus Electronema sp. JM]|uniref:CHASE2 domain-containing protein n=1 Tax=Candidatus Electronema sp. JM TaxID=3401571 RepID=UPI003AA8B1D8